MRSIIPSIIIVGGLMIGAFASAQMSSSNFEIRNDSLSVGGDDISESASYLLRDTIGNASIGQGVSTSYDLRAGYRQGIFDQVLSFDLFVQNSGTSEPATSLIGTTISASTAGISVGDFILLVQDEGIGQIQAVGEVVSLGIGTITLDVLKDAGVVPSIDGVNDVLYKMDANAIGLGELDLGSIAINTIAFNVNADLTNGYTIQVVEDGELRSGADDINDVADGAVTVGVEEYGARSSDASLAGSTFDTVDTAFTTSFQDIADESGVSFESRNFLEVKTAIDGGTNDGNYSQTLTFIISGNF